MSDETKLVFGEQKSDRKVVRPNDPSIVKCINSFVDGISKSKSKKFVICMVVFDNLNDRSACQR